LYKKRKENEENSQFAENLRNIENNDVLNFAMNFSLYENTRKTEIEVITDALLINTSIKKVGKFLLDYFMVTVTKNYLIYPI
jgi:hypothetical protein